MCVYSLVLDHYHHKWEPLQPYTVPTQPWPYPWTPQPIIPPSEIIDFTELLRKAKEYDEKNNEPDCELESKKDKIRKLAEKLGVEIAFP